MNLPHRKHRSLAQGVVEQISAVIRQGMLKPGDKLPTESSLMSQHGVSRTVVREAISHLQAAGLVQTRHGIGTFVLERPQAGLGLEAENMLTLRDVLSILELRIGVETETAGLKMTDCGCGCGPSPPTPSEVSCVIEQLSVSTGKSG